MLQFCDWLFEGKLQQYTRDSEPLILLTLQWIEFIMNIDVLVTDGGDFPQLGIVERIATDTGVDLRCALNDQLEPYIEQQLPISYIQVRSIPDDAWYTMTRTPLTINFIYNLVSFNDTRRIWVTRVVGHVLEFDIC
jgi:hypothetical protein